jgi:tetratricopeptide (TPR) repeat protein
MKVFLSHSTKDKEFVQRLADALTGAGFTPWLCEVDIEKNENFVAKIEKGLAECDVALVVWSPDAAKSEWTTEEWTSVLARQVAEQKTRLGIVLLRECPLQVLFRTKNYIDARWDQGAGLGETVKWLKRRESVQRLSGLKAPVYLPDYRPKNFVGRGAHLGRLREMLAAEPGTFLLYGEPGTGKSTLAMQFAWEAQKDFDAVVFQACGTRSITEITAELADRLPIEVKAQAPDEKRRRSMQLLRERQSLLVLDDVWGRDAQQLEPGPPCSVLYTSRQQSLPWLSSDETLKLESFGEEEAEQYFHAYLDKVFGEDEVTKHREALLEFAHKVEMLPIAVAAGASILREKSASRLDRSVLKLRLDDLNDGVRDVPQLFQKAIASQAQLERRLLAASAVCEREGFWLPLAAQIADLNEDDADEAANHLANASLLRVLDREERRFQLHSLLRGQVRTSCGVKEIETLQQHHAAALERLFEDWETSWRDCRACLAEIIPAAKFLWERNASGRQTWLSQNGCVVARRIGRLENAFRILKQEESFHAGHSDRETLELLQRSYGNQGLILQAWGRLEEALALHKKEEATCLELGNKDSLQRSYGNQGLILQAWGRLEEALALHKKQEAICLELGNKNGLGYCYWQWGLLARQQGDQQTERQKFEQALAIFAELKMPRERDAVQADLGKTDAASSF